MYLLGQKMLVWVPHQQDLYASTQDHVTTTQDLLQRGCQTPKPTVGQWLGYSAEPHLAEGTRTSLTQNQHSSPQLAKLAQGEDKAGRLLQLRSVKGSTPQATEKMHGVCTPTRLAEKSGALLLSLVKLKQLWKHLAEGCRCFQWRGSWREALRSQFWIEAFAPSWSHPQGLREHAVPISNLLWRYKY